jgi:diaminopimelate epimerase
MKEFSFSKLIPGGNPTIILHDPDFSDCSLAEAAAALMSPLHLQAEQVGALYPATPDHNGALPRLLMMGGEFCVNATRAAAMILALQGKLRQLSTLPALSDPSGTAPDDACREGKLLVSGMEDPVRVLVCSDADGLIRTLTRECAGDSEGAFFSGRDGVEETLRGPELFCAARIVCAGDDTVHRALGDGIDLVRMPGISHVLVDGERHPVPEMNCNAWKEQTRAFRRKAGVTESPASGVVWFQRDGRCFRIRPAVEVLATASEHLESACGSASLALALLLWRQSDAPAMPVDVLQPSGGMLRIFPDRGQPGAAWISGPVFLAAQGTAYL